MFSNPIVAYYAYSTCVNKMEQQRYYDALNGAVYDFLSGYYQSDDVDQGIVDCVVGRVDEALTDYRNGGGFNTYLSRLEGSSTYVEADLSGDELDDYVNALMDCLAAYDLI